MRSLALLLFLVIAPLCLTAAGERRYLYASTPDGAQKDGASGNGILVFDIDNGHRFVRRIDVPNFNEGLRGFCGSAKNRCVYYSTTNRRIGSFNLETEKVVWDQQFKHGLDRACVSLDGTKIYAPTGWWLQVPDSGLLVIDAATGGLLKEIPIGRMAHNSLASLDGNYVYLGTETNLSVLSVTNDSLIRKIGPVGESGVFPFTVDSRNRYAYVCLGKHVGFDVVDLAQGTALHRVLAGATPISHRTHGAGLTPDERELWISDQDGKQLFIFDATKMPPVENGHIDLSMGGHGWITFSLDGRFAWCHTPDVIDARTRKVVATLRDEQGHPFASSKFIEVHFRRTRPLRIRSQTDWVGWQRGERGGVADLLGHW